MIGYDTHYLVGLVEKYKDLSESERFKSIYYDIKERILKEANITRTISKADLIFVKTFISKEDPTIIADFEQTFGKYLKGEYD